MNSEYAKYLFSDSPVPHFQSQPFEVFSTPGLGNFVNDHWLFTPVRSYETNVKEVEKDIDISDEGGGGGFELNAPLIVQPIVVKTSKKKKRKAISRSSSQTGHGKKITKTNADDDDIEDALQHPIKVFET